MGNSPKTIAVPESIAKASSPKQIRDCLIDSIHIYNAVAKMPSTDFKDIFREYKVYRTNLNKRISDYTAELIDILIEQEEASYIQKYDLEVADDAMFSTKSRKLSQYHLDQLAVLEQGQMYGYDERTTLEQEFDATVKSLFGREELTLETAEKFLSNRHIAEPEMGKFQFELKAASLLQDTVKRQSELIWVLHKAKVPDKYLIPFSFDINKAVSLFDDTKMMQRLQKKLNSERDEEWRKFFYREELKRYNGTALSSQSTARSAPASKTQDIPLRMKDSDWKKLEEISAKLGFADHTKYAREVLSYMNLSSRTLQSAEFQLVLEQYRAVKINAVKYKNRKKTVPNPFFSRRVEYRLRQPVAHKLPFEALGAEVYAAFREPIFKHFERRKILRPERFMRIVGLPWPS